MDICELKRWFRANFFAMDRDITLQDGRVFSGAGAFPLGCILIWSGSIASIPDNWQLCNGTNGTPDLRDQFVVGAGDTYAVDDTGGASTHTHTVSGTTGNGASSTNASNENPGSYDSTYDHTHTYSVTSGSGNHRPPFYALAYVQRTS